MVSRETKRNLSGEFHRVVPFLTQPISRTRIFIAIGLIVTVLGNGGSGDSENPTTPVHHFSGSCHTCHEPATESAGEGPSPVGKLFVEINQACTQGGCHTFDKALSHPLGGRPLGTIPQDLPLDRRGHLTCLTCHDEVGRMKGWNDLSGDKFGRSNFLRREAGMEFCASCHTKMTGSVEQRSHWLFTTQAHLTSTKTREFQKTIYADALQNIDRETRTCLSCHDNITAAIRSKSSLESGNSSGSQSADHPIGMVYENVHRGNLRGFRAKEAINPRVRFFNGRMGCGSCHSLYNRNPKYLVDTYDRGVLCKNCHNK
jgi:hypothetical protein